MTHNIHGEGDAIEEAASTPAEAEDVWAKYQDQEIVVQMKRGPRINGIFRRRVHGAIILSDATITGVQTIVRPGEVEIQIRQISHTHRPAEAEKVQQEAAEVRLQQMKALIIETVRKDLQGNGKLVSEINRALAIEMRRIDRNKSGAP